MPFTCDHEGCGRSYLRKEHLTRHKKEHAKIPSFECPSCGTKFTRGDTLRRHMVLHGPSAPPTRVAQACVSCHRMKTRCDGQQPVCSTCHEKGKSCEWPQPRGKPSSLKTVRSSPPSSSLLAAACTPSPDPVILMEPMMPGMPPAGLLTQTAMPLGLMTDTDMFDFVSGSMLDEGVRRQLQSVYFEHFHPQWPLLHRESFESTSQPKLLIQAVVTVGLWFSPVPEYKDLAIKFHDHLLKEMGNMLLDMLEESRQGLLSPRSDLLPILQAVLISTILVPYRADKAIENVMMTHAMLLEIFKAIGVYDQQKINTASQLYGSNAYPWVFRELYQRLAIFQFKIHLVLQAIFITIYPALRISRNAEPAMLKINVPMPLMMWDGPAAQWSGMIPTDPELLDDDEDDILIISKMCDRAILMMDNKPLLPLLSWDRCLGMAIWCWCMKHSQSDREFIESIKPFVLEPLNGAGVHYNSVEH
ncbi:C2H2 type zinc finger domain protein [Colletotrichum truncatum]|uniref:C2H2 type zinc finger domain protein n=1 Tax=Colletotrichum truncatum TaxID=5467 RepID=A0ACC3YLR4_COLTU|nr:C2H2 type zinc finger domain protein [Colletotrichum truncatum]KAF6791452.1 C2H2 type zinc finger domain protein [Colletotrichum truncatum]